MDRKLNRHPSSWESKRVCDRDELPTCAGVYAVINTWGHLFYIGKTKGRNGLRGRWGDHHRLTEAEAVWGGRIAWLELSPKAVDKAEGILLDRYQTDWNNTPKRRYPPGFFDVLIMNLRTNAVAFGVVALVASSFIGFGHEATEPPRPTTQQQPTANHTARVKTTGHSINLWGDQHTIIGTVPNGSRVSITGGIVDGYYPVQLGDGREGWLYADYLQTN